MRHSCPQPDAWWERDYETWLSCDRRSESTPSNRCRMAGMRLASCLVCPRLASGSEGEG